MHYGGAGKSHKGNWPLLGCKELVCPYSAKAMWTLFTPYGIFSWTDLQKKMIMKQTDSDVVCNARNYPYFYDPGADERV